MKTINLPSGAYYFIKVPQGFFGYEVCNTKSDGLWFFVNDRLGKNQWTKLPYGNWELFGKASDMTEGKWKEIVEETFGGFGGHIPGFKDYNPKAIIIDAEPLETATKSGLSLLSLHGFDLNTVILKHV